MGFRLNGTIEFLKTKYVTTTPHHVGHWPQNTRCWKNTEISVSHTFTYTFFPQKINHCLQQSLMSSSSLIKQSSNAYFQHQVAGRTTGSSTVQRTWKAEPHLALVRDQHNPSALILYNCICLCPSLALGIFFFFFLKSTMSRNPYQRCQNTI